MTTEEKEQTIQHFGSPFQEVLEMYRQSRDMELRDFSRSESERREIRDGYVRKLDGMIQARRHWHELTS